ncbi:MAG TPA: murein biosynthesis integral membrane protein MurJ [Kiritimatiellia bacterium]|nr:murein biosynthesis integral membrane protein MurJ [Kiritimatiellia bacterium]
MEKNRVIRSAFKVGSFTSLSRVLGLVRDILTAGLFGTSSVMSDFVVAFRLPNLFRALFGEGALSSAFVPVFMATRKQEGDESAWLLARKTTTLLAAFLLVLVLLLVLATFALERLHPDLAARAPHVLPLMRLMLPYVLFICIAGLLMAMLNACHRFSLPAFTPSLLNMVWIGFVLLVCPRLGGTPEQQIYGVAAAVFVAGLVQMGVQVPALMNLGFRPGFTWDTSDPRVRRVFALMGPTALGQSVTQVNVMVNTLLARWAAPWAPASLFYAERLIYLPQGLLATAMSTVLLPVFSGHVARGEHAEMRNTLNHALRTLLFVMIPASIGLLVLAGPIVQMLFGRGRFDAAAVAHTAIALQFYAPGLMVFCLAKVFVPAFYALQDTRTPFRIGLRAVALNFVLNVVFVTTWPYDYKHAGLALATVISEGMNGLTLAVLLHRRLGSPGWATVFAAAARALGCSAVMALLISLAHPLLASALTATELPTKVVEIASVLIAIALGLAAYFACAFLIRAPELAFARDALQRRRRAAPTIADAG